MSLIRSQRDSWTTSGVSGSRRWPGLEDVDAPVDPAGRAVAPAERRQVRVAVATEESDELQDRTRLRRREFRVLGAERIDRRRDHVKPVAVDPVGRELGAGEHERVDRIEIRPDERPADLGRLVRRVTPDVTSPDDVRAGGVNRRGQTGRLGVVQDHDVVRPDEREQLAGVVVLRLLVRGVLFRSQWSTVSTRPVEVVVNPLRHLEERRVTFDHDPAGVDPDAAHVREQRLEQLGDSSARRGRVHVHDPAAGELRPGGRGGALEPSPRVPARSDPRGAADRALRLRPLAASWTSGAPVDSMRHRVGAGGSVLRSNPRRIRTIDRVAPQSRNRRGARARALASTALRTERLHHRTRSTASDVERSRHMTQRCKSESQYGWDLRLFVRLRQ